MMTTYALAPSFKWYFLDAEGRPAAGGTMETWQDSTLLIPKPVFKDPAGTNEYQNPIPLDATGGTPVPMYWEDDGTSKYFVVVRDINGDIIAQIGDYPIDGAGGGTPVTQTNDIENFIINGQFHIIDPGFFVDMPVSDVPDNVTITLAPGGGVFETDYNSYSFKKPIVGDQGTGWAFTKQGGSGVTDTLTFVQSDIGGVPPNFPSKNTRNFIRYNATGAGDPITELQLRYSIPDIRTFSGKTITVSFDCTASAGSALTSVSVLQDFGTGAGASATVITSENFTFPVNDWGLRQSVDISVPSISGKNIGADDNARFILAINIPPNEIGTVFDITNVQMQESVSATSDFLYKTIAQTQYELMPSIVRNVNSTTGDVKFSMAGVATYGWIVLADDNQTIGNSASGASFAGGLMRDLFALIYVSYPDSAAPVLPGGRSGTTYADAIADFDANKFMRFPPLLGRALAGAGVGLGLPSHLPGEFLGAETHILTEAEMPAHTHLSYAERLAVRNASETCRQVASAGNADLPPSTSGVTGGGLPHSILQPTHYLYLHIKL